MHNAIGLIEINSVAKGFEVTDDLIKTAGSELVDAHSVCPGKFIVLVTGTTANVESSISKGKETAGDTLIDYLVIPNVHMKVVQASRGTGAPVKLRSLGVIETFSAAACIIASDTAVKGADVDLIDIRLANALGGKAYVTMTGEVGAVRSAVNAGCMAIRESGMLVRRVIIPNPHPDLAKSVL